MDDLIPRLRKYGRIEVGEHLIEYAGEWQRIEKDDRYLGQHGDQKPELLTCRRREVQRRSSGRTLGKFFPKERKDSKGDQPRLYTLEEVIKVIVRSNPNYDPTKKEQPREQPRRNPFPELAPPSDGAPNTGGPERDGADAGAGEDVMGDPRPAERKPVPVPRPGPKPPKRGAEHRDPRQPAGVTDYSAASRKS